MTDNDYLSINQLSLKNKNITMIFKAIELLEEPKEVSSRRSNEVNKVAVYKVADDTGCINFTVWNENIDLIKLQHSFKLTKGYCLSFKNHLTLNVSKEGKIETSEKEIENLNTENDMSKPLIKRRKRRHQQNDYNDWSKIDDVSVKEVNSANRRRNRRPY